MKRIHTESKKAKRSSAYSKGPSFRGPSSSRQAKRKGLQPTPPHLFGLQLRTQAIKIRKKFRSVVKTIFHQAHTNN